MTLKESTHKPQIAATGETLGAPHGSWPSWCTTFRERSAYQQGVADARAYDDAVRPVDQCDRERYAAIREGEEIGASDRFFEARASVDTPQGRNLFRHGYFRGYDKGQGLK